MNIWYRYKAWLLDATFLEIEDIMFALHNLIDFLSEYSICEISKAFTKGI